jgi:hypothetical protein
MPVHKQPFTPQPGEQGATGAGYLTLRLQHCIICSPHFRQHHWCVFPVTENEQHTIINPRVLERQNEIQKRFHTLLSQKYACPLWLTEKGVIEH